MRRSVLPDKEFNPQQFAELLQKAKGQRTQTKFANDCGLSVAYICKYLNGSFRTAPTPETLKKMAAATKDYGVTIKELMLTAGYTDIGLIQKANSDLIELSAKEYANICVSSITKALFKQEFIWTADKDNFSPSFSDMAIQLESGPIKKWLFDFSVWSGYYHFNKSFRNILGRYMFLPSDEPVKVSLVLNSRDTYKFMTSQCPKKLAVYLSCILIDPKSAEVIEEKYIETALPITPEIENIKLVAQKANKSFRDQKKNSQASDVDDAGRSYFMNDLDMPESTD